jgi:polyhydroxyalkanoate synthesis regulator phasin
MPAAKQPKRSPARSRDRGVVDGFTSFAEQLANRIIRPLGLVMLTRERIQETLDDAVRRGRVTRSDANDLVLELVRRGRQQTDELLADVDRLLGAAGRRTRVTSAQANGQAASEAPIPGYDDLTAAQVGARLGALTPAQLRAVRDYERRHANRKSVLTSIEKALR